MVNARRAARELALKALFQLDIGKQPRAEVISGALDQIRHTVDHPVSQLLFDVQTELKQLIETHRSELSSQSLRQVRNVAKAMQAEMGALIAEVSRRTAEMLANTESMSVVSVSGLVQRDGDGAVERMRRARVRETLQPQLVGALVDTAVNKASQVPAAFSRYAGPAHAAASFLHVLVEGTLSNRAEIDSRIAELSEGWALDRQPAVDRNILRIAGFEILFLPEVPAGASINEAVELAKKFSTAESGRFVNGVLGTLAASVGKEERAELRAATEEPTADLADLGKGAGE